MKMRIWMLFLVMGLLVFCLAACSSNERETPAETQTTSQTEETAPAEETPSAEEGTPAGEPTEPVDDAAEPATEPESTREPETSPEAELPPEGAFSRAATALDELDSYRYSTLFAFVGEEAGEVEAGSIELTGIVAGPDRKHLIWHNLEEDEQFEVIRIGDKAWMLDDGAWEEVPIMVAEAMSDAVLIYAPSTAWGGVFGELGPTADYVGKETVNGVSAHHYTSTYEQWGSYWPGTLEHASGDVWIAEAGYPVKYDFSATGIDEDGNRGSITWRMDLTNVNADLTIEPPI